jgi:hypothetical protein
MLNIGAQHNVWMWVIPATFNWHVFETFLERVDSEVFSGRVNVELESGVSETGSASIIRSSRYEYQIRTIYLYLYADILYVF